MMLADVQLEVVDGFPVAHVRGEVDMSNADDVGRAVAGAVEHVGAGIVIDLSPTDYLDSAGLHILFGLGKRLRDRGQRLQLVVPPDSPVAGVLDVVRVDAVATRAETLTEALDRLRAHADDVPPA